MRRSKSLLRRTDQNSKIFLLLTIVVFSLLPSPLKAEDEKQWISSIRELSAKGLVGQDLLTLIETREYFSRMELAKILVVMINNFPKTDLKQEDVFLIEKLADEFKYELLLIRLQNTEGKLFKNRIALSGDIKLISKLYHGDLPGEKEYYGELPSPTRIGITQQLRLYLTGEIISPLTVFVNLIKRGDWGGESYLGGEGTAGPLSINEAYLRLNLKYTDIQIGKVRFSFGPLSILAGNEFDAIEAMDGLKMETAVKGFSITSLLGRITTDYYPNTFFVAGQDNYIASRICRNLEDFKLGINYVGTGLGKDKGYGFDLSGEILKKTIIGEYARYKPSSDTLIEDKGWKTAFIAGIDLFNWKGVNCHLRYGDIDRYFFPYYTHLASSDARLNYGSDTKGWDITFSKRFPWFQIDLEHLYFIEKSEDKVFNTSIVGVGTILLKRINLLFEYYRLDNEEQDSKYGEYKLTSSVEF